MAANNLNAGLDPDALWYKDAIIYEVHVRAFYDSEDNGMGDFRGLIKKLDYLQDLGVNTIWLLPFFPSPWRDDGYDISSYTDVHPSYGTLRDFQTFLKQAHRRGIRVITEVVLNHTSDQHPWFQRARNAPPGSRWRDFYVWSDSPDKYQDARIIFPHAAHLYRDHRVSRSTRRHPAAGRRPVPERRVPATRIRLHDDLRLEQILYTGKDFVFVGFGGRADRPLSERRIKRPPLRDVAGLLLSFEYAAHAVLFDQVPGVTRRPEVVPALEFWGGYWRDWVSAMFLKSYFESVDTSALHLENAADVRLLLDVFLMERALEEGGRELTERPALGRNPNPPDPAPAGLTWGRRFHLPTHS